MGRRPDEFAGGWRCSANQTRTSGLPGVVRGLPARLTTPDMHADVAAAIHLQNAAAIHMQTGGSYHNTKKSQKLWLRIARGK